MERSESEKLIVISGVSGRFSGASDINELWDRLCRRDILYGPDETPYPKVLQNLPKARGSIKNSGHFDNSFFGITKDEADLLDGQVRLLYEVTYEAFLDAGILPQEWSQTRTGVFIGSFIDDTDLTPRSSPFFQSIPSRLSFYFNLKGPSIRVDTACASSLTALQLAKLSLESGECDQAIVAGLCVHQRTFLNPSFADHGILSKRGVSSPLDKKADGYVRSEAVISMIVQTKASAKRIYGKVIGIKSNTDGYTQEGITFPNGLAQKNAMLEALKSAKVKPSDIKYIEAHLTGTQAGDKTECQSILEAYRPDHKDPIYVGALKSNLGHTEAAAGLASITKAIMILKNECIPPMIPPNEFNPEIEPLINGQIVPVTEMKDFCNELIAVNAFGFGGANVHVILQANGKKEASWPDTEQRLFLLTNRTRSGIEKTLSLLGSNNESRSNEFLSLLDHISTLSPRDGMIYRAYGTIGKGSILTKEIKKLTSTSPLGVIVLDPLKEPPTHLLNISELRDNLNCAKSFNEFALTFSILELFNNINLRADFVVGMDSLATELCSRTKSLKQIVKDMGPRKKRASVDVTKVLPQLDSYLHKSLQTPGKIVTCENLTIWSSKSLTKLSNLNVNDFNLLIINGNVNILNSGQSFTDTHQSVPKWSIWQIIGQLYLLGQSIDLKKIYPPPDYPVHKKCPSISPLIQWDHKNVFSNNIYPDYFKSPIQTVHHIDLFDPEYANMSDHIIDGNIIMPAAGFIYLVVKHLGLIYPDQPLNVGQFSFKLWDVKFILACPIHEEIDIIVVHDPATFKFVVKSSHAVYVTGSASMVTSKQTDNTDLDLRIESSQDDDELKLSDIYPHFRLRGYHFGQKYQNLVRSKSSRSVGYIKYGDDWVAFLDGLIQIDQFWEKTRLIKVPTSIKSLEFDCNRFTRALNEVKDLEGLHFLMTYSPGPGHVSTYGFNLDGIGWSAIRKRVDMSDEPKLATNKFQSFSENVIDLDTDLQKEIREYHNACISVLRKNDVHKIVENNSNKNLYKFLVKINRCLDQSSFHIEQESNNLWNDILLSWPDTALCSLLEIVLANLKYSDGIRIGHFNHLPNLYRDKINKLSQSHRKFCEYFDMERQSFEKGEDIDMIIHIDESSKLLPHGTTESIEKKLEKFVNFSQLFVLIQFRVRISDTEKEICDRLHLNHSRNGPRLIETHKPNFESLGYTLIAQSFVKQTSIKFELYRKKLDVENLVIMPININTKHYNWIEEIKNHLADEKVDRVWLISQQTVTNGVLGLLNCLRLEPNGNKLRCCCQEMDDNYSELSVNELKEIYQKDLAVNIYRDESWGCMILKDINLETENKVISEHYYYTFDKAGMLETLNWSENYTKTVYSREKLIKVAYSAINFRDTLIASGVVPVEAYPDENCFDLGLEFSGVTYDGKRVMGVVLSRGFTSYVPVDSVAFMFPIPDNWSLQDAATVPICYMTAYYALIIRGDLKPGETVLIHSGSGGVGLAAISISLSLGCKVFTTVSTREKRLAVISMFPQLDENVSFADSRSTSFEDHIHQLTDGRGVDIVLNSLTEDKLAAGIRCLAPGGRFVDLSKRDFIQDNQLEKLDLVNKSFETVCLVYLLTSLEDNLRCKAAIKMIEKLFAMGFQTGQIVPLPSKVYDKQSVEDAFRFMRKGQHIGKLLIKMNEYDEKNDIHIEPLLVNRITYFYPHKSYLIVGGLGGMGLELVRWMTLQGARKIVLSSRSGLRTNYQRYCLKNIRDLTNNQVTIVIVRFDLTKFRGSARAIREATRLGPIGGIFNLAAVLKDDVFEKQSTDSFTAVCDPKIKITHNLDNISRNECSKLDYFVCFSSIAVHGNLGQTSYAYANCFMERICESRVRDGLPGLAIEWGPIADVGLAARTFGDKQAISGYHNQSVDSFLKALDIFLNLSYPICYSAIPVIQKTVKSSDAFTKVARIMGLKDISSIDHNKTLRELGMDSVQAIEIQMYLSQEFKQSVKQFTIAELTLNDLKTMSQPILLVPEDANTVDSNKVMREKLLIPLNNIKHHPIFFFPPAIADFLSMMPLAESLDYQVIGVNFTDEALAIENFDELTELYYQALIQTYSDLPNYLFVAYSFGVPIAYDIARKIQDRLGQNRIEKMIFIDTSPVGQQSAYKFFRRLRETEGFGWEMLKDPRLSMDRKRGHQSDRLKIIKILEGITGDSNEKNFEEFFGYWDRISAIIQLTFERKFTGQIIHYQATEQPSAFLDSLNADLELAVNGPVDHRYIKSNHFEIINYGKEDILSGIRECLEKFENH